MKNTWLILLFFFGLRSFLLGQIDQNLSLESCYDLAIKAAPLNEQFDLLEQANVIKNEQLDIGRMPDIRWNAQASFQTENIKLPFELPGLDPIELPLVQARTSLDANYLLTDWGRVDYQKQIHQAELATNKQEVHVQLRQLKEAVNQYFLGVLLLQQQEQILENAKKTLEVKVPPIESGIKNGILLESELSRLEVEVLKIEAQIESIQKEQDALLAVLGQLIEQDLDRNVQLELPDLSDFALGIAIDRPELQLFDLQKQAILAKENILTIANKPQLTAFLQAGVGYPNPLNFFEEAVSPFAIIGARFSWKFIDWGKTDKDRQMLSIQVQSIDTQRKTFIRNIDTQEGRFQEKIAQLEALIKKDKAIKALQEKILEQLSAQLDHGVITSSDYIVQVNAVTDAQLSWQKHQMQLQQLKVEYWTLRKE